MSPSVNGLVGHALTVDREREMSEGIVEVRVATVLAHDDLRGEGLQYVGNHGVEGAEPALVARPGRERHVDRAPEGAGSPDFLGESGPGEEGERTLVQGDREHAGVVVEHRLDAIAMVDVHVDVGNSLDPLGEQPGDGDADVVVDAEPSGRVGHRVMQAACDVDRVLHATGVHRLRRHERRSRHESGCLVHPREGGIVGRAESADGVDVGWIQRGALHCRDVLELVYFGDLLDAGGHDG